jgi:hypothetical protein
MTPKRGVQKETDFGSPHTSCVTLENALSLSEPQLAFLSIE